MDGNVLTDETGPTYCLMEPGVFLMTLEVTDNASGCSNQFSLGVSFNPAYTCASASGEIAETANTLVLFPNPTAGSIWANFEVKKPGPISMEIFDVIGKKVWQETLHANTTDMRHELDLGRFPGGIYLLKIQTEDGYISGRILKE